jgi:hypothetical protein
MKSKAIRRTGTFKMIRCVEILDFSNVVGSHLIIFDLHFINPSITEDRPRGRMKYKNKHFKNLPQNIVTGEKTAETW